MPHLPLNCLCSQDKDVILSYYQYDGLAKDQLLIDGRSRELRSSSHVLRCESTALLSASASACTMAWTRESRRIFRVALTTGGCLLEVIYARENNIVTRH